MPLPENMLQRLVASLTADGLLEKSVAAEIAAQLDSGKPVQWNILLNKQIELEKGGADEAHD